MSSKPKNVSVVSSRVYIVVYIQINLSNRSCKQSLDTVSHIILIFRIIPFECSEMTKKKKHFKRIHFNAS